LALLYYAERPKTKRQDTSGKPLKSGRKAGDQDEEDKRGEQDVSFDLDSGRDAREKRKEKEREREKYR